VQNKLNELLERMPNSSLSSAQKCIMLEEAAHRVELSEQSSEFWKALFGDKDVDVRIAAFDAFAACDAPHMHLHDSLVKISLSGSACSFYALRCLADRKYARTLEICTAIFSKGSLNTRIDMVRIARIVGDKNAIDFLLQQRLSCRDRRLRVAISCSLCECGNNEDVSFLERQLKNSILLNKFWHLGRSQRRLNDIPIACALCAVGSKIGRAHIHNVLAVGTTSERRFARYCTSRLGLVFE
jgi:hypothetical protein